MARKPDNGGKPAPGRKPDPEDRWRLSPPLEASLRHKLAICEAAYRAGEPLAAAEALTLLFLYFKPPAWAQWIEAAVVEVAAKRRTKQQAERHREKMRHLMRYAAVRDQRRKGMTKNKALDATVKMLAESGEAVARDTIEASYDQVRRDFRDLGQRVQAKYFLLKDKRYLSADDD